MPLATKGWEPKVLAALRDVGVTVIVPGGKARTSRPTPPTPLIKLTSFAIGCIRKTSWQLTIGDGGVQLAPAPVIFHTLPWPVVPSPVQRLPSRSKATPLVPGMLDAKIVAFGGLLAFGVNV